MSDEHREMSELMGAYLLGDIDPVEHARLQAHLDGCPACRAELASLTPVVAALADVDASALAETQAPDAGLARRVVAEVASQRRHQQRVGVVHKTGLAVAASLLAVAGFGLGVVADDDEAPPPTVAALEPVSLASSRPGIEASADLVDHTWGLEIKLTADGLRDGVRYRGTVRATDGRMYSAGAFQGVADTTILCNMATAVLREDAVAFVVKDPDGKPVLRSKL